MSRATHSPSVASSGYGCPIGRKTCSTHLGPAERVVGRPDRKQIALFQSFDIPFRLRRIRAIVKVINSAYDKATDRTGPDACKRSLADVVCRYEVAMTDTGDDLK